MPEESFDYGEKQEDGQYENYPTVDEGELKEPYRRTYIHVTCGEKTTMSHELALSIARDPDYYNKAYCTECEDHFSIKKFKWKADGVTVGE